jgi:hypothetical protein
MNSFLNLVLKATPEQAARLLALQSLFAQACNELAPLVKDTRCWNRVTLHHLAYKTLREKFPNLGSQMACNAIYSVARTSRQVYQHPQSPFNLARLNGRALPLLHFTDSCPVYFDRHTLSVKEGQLSMYTLDGRMRFELMLSEEAEKGFREKKLREIILSRNAQQDFQLGFSFAESQADPAAEPAEDSGDIPEYVLVEENNERQTTDLRTS